MVFRCSKTDSIYNNGMNDKKAGSERSSNSPPQQRAYPFNIGLVGKDNPAPRKAQVMKMTNVGFIMQTDASFLYKVHDNYDLQFTLPGSSRLIAVSGKVVKTYDAMEARINIEKIKVYLVEMHFINLAKDFKRTVVEFCNANNNEKK